MTEGREATVSSCRNCRAVIYRDRVGWLHENGWTDCAGGPETQAEPGRETTPACEWCGRALRQIDGAWWAVKGEERGYHPPYCDAADDSRHSPASSGRMSPSNENGIQPPTHDGPCVESLDGDGEPLGYCVTCYQPLTCCTDARKADPKKEWTWHDH